jgi:hypothetical protein
MSQEEAALSELPRWDVAELPAPPAFNFRNGLAGVGAGTMALFLTEIIFSRRILRLGNAQ